MKPSRIVVAAALFAFATAGAQKGSGLAGTVLDTLNKPLPMVTVFRDSSEFGDVTDKDGRFFIKGLPAGKNPFTVMRPGFRTVTFTADLMADSTLVVSFHMRPVNTLAPISITAEASIAELKRTGYYERERHKIGTFLTPQFVDSMAPRISTAAQLLREVPGVEVSCPTAGRCTVRTRRGNDCLRLFVDGMAQPGQSGAQIDDAVPLGEIAAVEVYPNPNQVPTEFQGQLPSKSRFLTARAGCGAIAVWTRAKVAR